MDVFNGFHTVPGDEAGGPFLVSRSGSFLDSGEAETREERAARVKVVIDRLIHHAHLIAIPGESFRMKAQKSKQAKIIKAAA